VGARREHRVVDIAAQAGLKPVSIPSQVQVVTPYNEPASIHSAAEL
jgi:hypothetical protein